jgi:hypothetical protein
MNKRSQIPSMVVYNPNEFTTQFVENYKKKNPGRYILVVSSENGEDHHTENIDYCFNQTLTKNNITNGRTGNKCYFSCSSELKQININSQNEINEAIEKLKQVISELRKNKYTIEIEEKIQNIKKQIVDLKNKQNSFNPLSREVSYKRKLKYFYYQNKTKY